MNTPHFNQLTPAEAERLALLAEECAEVIQIVGKILRHGFDSTNPIPGASNRALLEAELGHVELAQSLLCSSHDVSPEMIAAHFQAKRSNVVKFLHHQPALFSARQTDQV